MKIAVCCIAKNENRYIREWVAYYKHIGFDDIYIYDNVSCDGTSEFLALLHEEGSINRVFWPRKEKIPPQRDAYCHFLENDAKKYDYVFFCDVDEFLSIEKGAVKQFLENAERKWGNVGAIAIPWLMFGSAGKELYEEKLVIERFDASKSSFNKEVKSFVKPEKAFNMRTHICDLMDGVYLDNSLEIASWSQERPIDLKKPQAGYCCIHHYYTKSRQEWTERRSGGKADRAKLEYRNLKEFDKYHHLGSINKDLVLLAPFVKKELTQLKLIEDQAISNIESVSVLRCDGGWLFIAFKASGRVGKVRLVFNESHEYFVVPYKKKDSYVFSLKLKWKNLKVSCIDISSVGGCKSVRIGKHDFPDPITTLESMLKYTPSAEENIFEFFMKSAKDKESLKQVCSYSYPAFHKYENEGLVLKNTIYFVNNEITREDYIKRLLSISFVGIADIKEKAQRFGCDFIVSYLSVVEMQKGFVDER